MRLRQLLTCGIAAVCVLIGAKSQADDRTATSGLCAALTRSPMPEMSGDVHAMFLPSYLPSTDGPPLPLPLQGTAFIYDNSLAAMAFLACGETGRARAIGDALIIAGERDRFFTDGRLRNAYRAGSVSVMAALPGWWDDGTKNWAEDEYQVSTASGNIAWSALALLQLYQKTNETKYLEAARQLGTWLEQTTEHGTAVGVRGGYYGFEPNASPIAWKSTEHNIDVLAVARWLDRTDEDPRWKLLADNAQQFVTSMRSESGGFLIGTDSLGKPAHSRDIWLDVQIWPFLVMPESQRPAEWTDVTALIDDRLAVAGGYDFNGDRDGVWIEGTAQAALLFKLYGDEGRSSKLIDTVLAHADPETGWLYATTGSPLSTGLTVGASGQGGAFEYQHWPHLGATAWAVLAATGFNPFRAN